MEISRGIGKHWEYIFPVFGFHVEALSRRLPSTHLPLCTPFLVEGREVERLEGRYFDSSSGA